MQSYANLGAVFGIMFLVFWYIVRMPTRDPVFFRDFYLVPVSEDAKYRPLL